MSCHWSKFRFRMYAHISDFRLNESSGCHIAQSNSAGEQTASLVASHYAVISSWSGGRPCGAGRDREGSLTPAESANRKPDDVPQGHILLLSLTGLLRDRRGGFCECPEGDNQEQNDGILFAFCRSYFQLPLCCVTWGAEAGCSAPVWAVQSWGSSAWRCRCWLQPPGYRGGWAR